MSDVDLSENDSEQIGPAECANCGVRAFSVSVNGEQQIRLKCRGCDIVAAYGWETSIRNLEGRNVCEVGTEADLDES